MTSMLLRKDPAEHAPMTEPWMQSALLLLHKGLFKCSWERQWLGVHVEQGSAQEGCRQ